MGTWGPGLYSNDTAADLKTTVGTLLRLPFGPEEILIALRQQEPSLNDPASEDYTACWFVVADRFHRYGVDHSPTFALVTKLIQDGTDLNLMAELGMSRADLRRREKVLNELATRLAHPHPKPSRRATLKRPQEFLVDVGDILKYPMMNSGSANPYLKDWAASRPPFEPDQIGAAVILDRGRTFDFLAWYTAAPLDNSWTDDPSLAECLDSRLRPAASGTLTPTHLKRMAITKVATVRFSTAVLDLLPPRRHSDYKAISDVSLSNVTHLDRRGAGKTPGPVLRELIEP
jgi:hypothetical protein